MQQLDGLGQLCELLSVSTEESLSVFPVEQLAPVLVRPLVPRDAMSATQSVPAPVLRRVAFV